MSWRLLGVGLLLLSVVVGAASVESGVIRGPLLRTIVAVEGVVYCKSCKFPKVDTLTGATPLEGAVARLQCNSRKGGVTVYAKTDVHGYFYMEAPKVSNFGVHKCKVFLDSSPSACKAPTNLNGGISGARLWFRKRLLFGAKPVALYSIAPIAFALSNATYPCTH